MKLMEAIIDANHRALAGDPAAGLHPAQFADALPMVALSCIDVRLNPLLPEVLGVPEEQFIWLRNAGNIITGTLSSTMRSLSLACAIKGGREIAIIGHTDCVVGRFTTAQLIERFRELGIDRQRLPDNLNEYFGTFASERQNVVKAVDFVRQSPLIGPRIPVHGLLVDIETGRLDWLVNGYQALETVAVQWNQMPAPADILKSLPDFEIGELKVPETKIGDLSPAPTTWVSSETARPPAPPVHTPPPSAPAPRAPAPPSPPSPRPGPHPPSPRPLPSVPRQPPAGSGAPPVPPRIGPLPSKPKVPFKKGWN